VDVLGGVSSPWAARCRFAVIIISDHVSFKNVFEVILQITIIWRFQNNQENMKYVL